MKLEAEGSLLRVHARLPTVLSAVPAATTVVAGLLRPRPLLCPVRLVEALLLMWGCGTVPVEGWWRHHLVGEGRGRGGPTGGDGQRAEVEEGPQGEEGGAG